MATVNNQKLAVLIDADNAQPKVIKGIFDEIAQYGDAIVRRIYGDWTTTNLNSWKEFLPLYAIEPIQQFRYTTGKNATDCALIIDAMDLLHMGNLDGFCIVSSDSDFTKLATRIRESAMSVYGFGEKKTPQSLIHACNKFFYTEIFRNEEQTDDNAEDAENATTDNIEKAAEIFSQALIEASKEDGAWVPLAAVGTYISKKHPSFDPRNYGFPKMGQLVGSFNHVEKKMVTDENSLHSNLYVRLKNMP